MALPEILDEAASLRQERRSMLDRARRHIARIKELETRGDKLEKALRKISTWREDCHAYDADMDHDLRDFDEEEVGAIENFAREALGDAAPPELTPEEDAADLRLARMARWGLPPEAAPSSPEEGENGN